MAVPRPKHHANGTRSLFQNPWQTPEEPDDNTAAGTTEEAPPQSASASQAEVQKNAGWFNSLTGGLPNLFANIPLEWARDLSKHGVKATKVVKPEFGKFGQEGSEGSVKATWLGHASFMLELSLQPGSTKPTRILFDPMFSERAGPSAWTGIRRRLPPPCAITELPEFHFVLISHNHYDHLDLPSIHEIVRTRGRDVTFLVPVGNKSWLLSLGIPKHQVHEFDWWDELKLARPGTSFVKNLDTRFVCVPAQHTSGRSVLDKCATLWCGWVIEQTIEQSAARIYHAGDTGYIGTNGPCPVFEEVGKRCGPFDLALLPIWRGGTLSFISQMGLRLTHHPLLSAMHASPADAVAIHMGVRSRHSLAMHFATFAGAESEALEPLIELAVEREKKGLGDWFEEGGIGAIDVGETVEIKVGEKNEQVSEGGEGRQ